MQGQTHFTTHLFSNLPIHPHADSTNALPSGAANHKVGYHIHQPYIYHCHHHHRHPLNDQIPNGGGDSWGRAKGRLATGIYTIASAQDPTPTASEAKDALPIESRDTPSTPFIAPNSDETRLSLSRGRGNPYVGLPF